jgi:hypothetical protein
MKVNDKLYPQYPLDRRLDGPYSWSGRGKEKHFLPCQESNAACSLDTILTNLSWLFVQLTDEITIRLCLFTVIPITRLTEVSNILVMGDKVVTALIPLI